MHWFFFFTLREKHGAQMGAWSSGLLSLRNCSYAFPFLTLCLFPHFFLIFCTFSPASYKGAEHWNNDNEFLLMSSCPKSSINSFVRIIRGSGLCTADDSYEMSTSCHFMCYPDLVDLIEVIEAYLIEVLATFCHAWWLLEPVDLLTWLKEDPEK